MILGNGRPILLATDFSAASAAAQGAAVQLARAFQHPIEVFHVNLDPTLVLPPPGGAISLPTVFERVLADVAERLDRVTAEILSAGVSCTGASELGRTHAAIVEHALRIGAALIVLGSHHRSGLRRVLFGSILQAVVDRAPCAVLLVPAESSDEPGPAEVNLEDVGMILAPSDFSATSEAALNTAVALAHRFHAPLEIFHVDVDPAATALLAENILPVHPIFQQLNAATAARLRLVVDQARRQGVRCTGAAEFGRSAQSILAHARRISAGLIVMGSAHRHGLARLLLSGVADKVVEHAPCSVLIVPRAPPEAEPPREALGAPHR